MPTNRNVIDFKIHNLTEEKFQELKDAGQIDPNAIYCTPDETKIRLDELDSKTTLLESKTTSLESKTTLLENNKQNKGDYVTNTALSEGLAQKQNIATAVNYDNITNCITEIPQDIKLELNNGTLTLKAGSIVYVPNGAGVFDAEIVNVDISFSLDANNTYMLFKQPGEDKIDFVPKNRTYSGPNITYGDGYGDYLVGYDTESNSCGLYENDGKNHYNFMRNESFPICIFTVSNGAISSIDQVFNGFGYIGSTMFALPGVKGLIPDGRNADGTLKNNPFETTNVLICQTTYNADYAKIGYTRGLLVYVTDNDVKYDSIRNIYYLVSSGKNWGGALIGSCSVAGLSFSSVAPKTTFRAVDYNDLTNTTSIASPAGIVSAFAGKTAPSGWLKCDGSAVSRTRYASLFAAIGTLYGAGDGSTTFNLPNLIDGRVPFGMAGDYVGQSTEGVLPNITGQFATSGTNQSGSGAIWYTQVSTGAQGWSGTGASNGQWDFNANRSNSMYGSGWFEGRKVVPASVGMSYCIKY